MKAASVSPSLSDFLSRYRPALVILTGQARGLEYRLDQPRTAVGRGPGVDLALDDESLRTRHALVEYRGGRFVLHVHNLWFNAWDRAGRRWLLRDGLRRLLGRATGDREMPAHQGIAGLALHHRNDDEAERRADQQRDRYGENTPLPPPAFARRGNICHEPLARPVHVVNDRARRRIHNELSDRPGVGDNHQDEHERVRPVRDPDCLGHAEIGGGLLLEGGHVRAEDELAGLEHFLHALENLRRQAPVLRPDVNERDRHDLPW